MFPYPKSYLQQLLEDETDNVGHFSQILKCMSIDWEIHSMEDDETGDPSERRHVCSVRYEDYAGPRYGIAYQVDDCSGEWSIEEWVLQLLELALRDLWRRAGAAEFPFSSITFW